MKRPARIERKPIPRPHYDLQVENGLYYVYENGGRHSRYGISPSNDQERRVLEAVPALLNQEPLPLPLMKAAFSMYLHRLW
ncbi:hypothetical protein ACQEUU_37575 [Nonomuraea sp. CA-218870]|uniref:hypothetical protein n=1 Tax=Nonomuraea sp. CA-218870 TaxID=3239998 RepID=UPI003D924345